MPRNPRKKAAPKKTRRTSYKKKSVFTLKNIIAGLVATVVIVGGAAAFALSQTNQDTRSAAYIPNESCGSLGKNDCPGVPGCSWQETESTLKCNNFETDACPSECHLVTAYTKCKPGYYVAPNGQASNCSQFSSSECTSKGCTLETVKACAGGEFTRAGAGKCTGTPKGSGSGGSSGGSTGGNSGGGSDSGGSSGGSTGETPVAAVILADRVVVLQVETPVAVDPQVVVLQIQAQSQKVSSMLFLTTMKSEVGPVMLMTTIHHLKCISTSMAHLEKVPLLVKQLPVWLEKQLLVKSVAVDQIVDIPLRFQHSTFQLQVNRQEKSMPTL